MKERLYDLVVRWRKAMGDICPPDAGRCADRLEATLANTREQVELLDFIVEAQDETGLLRRYILRDEVLELLRGDSL